MNYLIAGGEFVNKGSEAMIITTVNEIRRFDGDANIKVIIGYGEIDKEIERCLRIECIYYTSKSIEVLFSDKALYKQRAREVIKRILHVGTETDIDSLNKAFMTADYFLDISGYALSSKWAVTMNDFFLNRIKIARKKNRSCKIILLPQSFGPFDYDDSTYIMKIKETLMLCDYIFARETYGYNLLSTLGLTNIRKSPDSVLTGCSKIESLEKKINIDRNKIIKNSVGIIPNIRIFDKTNTDEKSGIEFYQKLLKFILRDTEAVYLIAHSGEDLEFCKKIKMEFENEDRVILTDRILHSFEFQFLVQSFKYIVASRFHSIVHAYKQGTPALIIGWAEKYDELAKVFGQEKYIINFDQGEKVFDNIVNLMDKECASERQRILNILPQIQQNSCWEFIRALPK